MSAIPPAWQECVAFANTHEVTWPRDPHAAPDVDGPRWGVHHDDPPPWNRLRGPVHERGGVSGVVLQGGAQTVAWGEPERADLTFSVAKTYLALLAGVAHGRGLLPDPDEPVAEHLPGLGFDTEHNRSITWTHLFEQTSEWEGECFGLPDTVDRYRKVALDSRPQLGRKGEARPLQAPGSYWEYNDVRINQLSLALLHLFGRPLPEVFGEAIMKPLGASDTWRWTAYDDAWVTLAGRRVQSVPGGSHWGAGVSISARDQARIGQLVLDGGRHGDKQLIPRQWLARMHRPCAMAPFYGWLTWLNVDRSSFASASPRSSFMVGAGGHCVWMEPAHDAVLVVRWLDPQFVSPFMALAAKALEAPRANLAKP
ncbi:MAG: serine hydrolase [Burkholderiaceae bacterium]